MKHGSMSQLEIFFSPAKPHKGLLRAPESTSHPLHPKKRVFPLYSPSLSVNHIVLIQLIFRPVRCLQVSEESCTAPGCILSSCFSMLCKWAGAQKLIELPASVPAANGTKLLRLPLQAHSHRVRSLRMLSSHRCATTPKKALSRRKDESLPFGRTGDEEAEEGSGKPPRPFFAVARLESLLDRRYINSPFAQ